MEGEGGKNPSKNPTSENTCLNPKLAFPPALQARLKGVPEGERSKDSHTSLRPRFPPPSLRPLGIPAVWTDTLSSSGQVRKPGLPRDPSPRYHYHLVPGKLRP